MNRSCYSFIKRSAILSLGGLLLTFTDPCAYLDEQTALLVIRLSSVGNSVQVSQIALPAKISEAEIAKEIILQRSNGVRGILLFLSPTRVRGDPDLTRALEMKDVVWVAEPSAIPPALRKSATCQPLLACEKYGSAVIGALATNNLLSAASVALTCTKDFETLDRLGTNSFKIPFRRDSYALPPTNATVVAITTSGNEEGPRYNTPSGQKSAPEYTLDICYALLAKCYLIEIPFWAKWFLVVALAVVLGHISSTAKRILALTGILLIFVVVECVEKLHLSIGTILLLSILIQIARPFSGQYASHDSVNP